MLYLTLYVLGVATALLAIALLGRKLLARIKWASDPKGWFQRGIAVLFILVGIFVATGWDKKVQTYLVEKDFLNIKLLEENLVPENDSSPTSNSNRSANEETFNIDAYAAPELKNIAAWINSDPQTVAGLKGKVVLIDFWTYSCINCQRTQPYLNAWYEKYKDAGFVLLGVHAPEFAFEKVTSNVRKAVAEANIRYPVALDNNFATWNAYQNKFWPAKYLIDKDGQVRYTHFGEGDYVETEKAIQTLLKESGKTITSSVEGEPGSHQVVNGQTPETYVGYDRAERFANAKEFKADQPVTYSLAKDLNSNEWSLGGKWQVSGESSQALGEDSKLSFSYSAREVYVVMTGPPGALVTLSVEGLQKPGGTDVDASSHIKIDGARLYKIISTDSFMSRKLTLTVPAGVTIHAFTFGS
jgi:thiol-disulfide isomerase/thioredoxin